MTTTYQAEFNALKPYVGAVQSNAEALWTSTSGNTVYNLSAADRAQLKPILGGIWTSFQSGYPAYYSAALKAVTKFKLSAYAPN